MFPAFIASAWWRASGCVGPLSFGFSRGSPGCGLSWISWISRRGKREGSLGLAVLGLHHGLGVFGWHLVSAQL